MKDMLREKVESQLNKIESQVANGIELSEEDISQTRALLNNVISMKKSAGYTDEEIKAIEDRFAKATNRNLNNDKKYSIKYIAKSFKTKVAAAVLVGTMGVTAIACTASKEEEPVEPVAMMAEAPEKVAPTTMDAEYKEIADQALAFANDEIAKGMPENMQITEENKGEFAKSLTEYYLLNQMDELTDEEWANIFQNSTVTSKDLMDAKYSWEWIDQQRVVVSDNYLDYSLLFDGKDAELLTGASEILTNVKSSDKTVKSEANKEFKQYVFDNLASDDSNILYSDRAMDTFRAVYFDAFDELTNHKVVDDELEHAINTTITCTIGESALNVEDKTIKGLQSEYQTYEMTKLDTRFQTGWNYVAVNHDEINEYNDISYMAEYVSENMDLSKQFVLPSYEETLTNMFLTKGGAKVNKHDSNISDGKGGHISNDVENGGIKPGETKEQYEQRIEKEQGTVEYIVDSKGNLETMSESQIQADYNAGYNRGLAGESKESGRSEYYNNGYDMGKTELENSKKAFPSNPTTSYENNTSNENTITNESEVITEYYTTDPVTDNYVPYVEENKTVGPTTPGTTFEPITDEFVPSEGEETTTESEITEFDYTGAINDLKALRDSLSASIDNQYSSSRSI